MNAAGWTLGLLCNLTFLPIRSWLNPGLILPGFVVFLSILAAFAIFALATMTLALLADPTCIE